jgi:alginate O-acetyltransferase complex protein AlgI
LLFSSFPYVFIFLPVVVLTYAFAKSKIGARSAQVWLLLSSLFFYGWAKPSNLPLLLGSIFCNWAMGRGIASVGSEANRTRLLWFGIGANLAFLFSFKYVNVFLSGLAALHLPAFVLPDLELPLGVSFFSLAQIMYLVDTYQAPETVNSFLDHATFASFFPYVTSGPISRSMEVVPQFKTFTGETSRVELACRGFFLFVLGLGKKVLLADSFGHIADAGFTPFSHYSTLEAWVFCLAYAFEIYFDFSGYSDMAIGSAWMLGIRLPINFNAPFRSKSMSEYWQRWHMSLSAFITHYLYTPILRSMGRRATIGKSCVAVIVAMSIAGLWHGPSLTYIFWGLLNGAALAVNQVWKRRKKRLPGALSWAVTFAFVNVTFVFFRSPTLEFAFHFLRQMLPQADLIGVSALRGLIPFAPNLLWRPIIAGSFLAFFGKTSTELAESDIFTPAKAFATAVLLAVGALCMNTSAAKTFLYFAF